MKSEWCEEVEQRRGRAASNTVFVKQVYRRRPFSFDTAIVKNMLYGTDNVVA